MKQPKPIIKMVDGKWVVKTPADYLDARGWLKAYRFAQRKNAGLGIFSFDDIVNPIIDFDYRPACFR